MSVCPQCGSPLPKTVLRGLCPRCTVRACLESAEAVEPAVQNPRVEGEELREANQPAPIPGRFFGGYELLEELGRGGMGVVYRARQVNVQREVALKMVAPQRLVSANDVQRFKLEAETAARLDHPNILPIYDVGECQGQPYFTMKLVRGGNLAGRVAEFTLRSADPASGDRADEKRRRALLLTRISQRRISVACRCRRQPHARSINLRNPRPILSAPGSSSPFLAK